MNLFDRIYLPIVREETTDGCFLNRRVSQTLLILLHEEGYNGTDDIMGLSMYVEQHIDDFTCLDHLLKLRKLVLHMHPNTNSLRKHFAVLQSLFPAYIDTQILRYPLF
jgi:hypothetical protein